MSWGQTRLLADHGTVYLYLKTKLLKIEKDSRRSPRTSKNWLFWSIANRGLTCLHHAFILAYSFGYRLFLLSIGQSSNRLSADHFDLWAHCQGWIPLFIGELCWPFFTSFNRPIALYFSSAAPPYPLWPVFLKKRCQHLVRTHAMAYYFCNISWSMLTRGTLKLFMMTWNTLFLKKCLHVGPNWILWRPGTLYFKIMLTCGIKVGLWRCWHG
jgi:hypothetical protein